MVRLKGWLEEAIADPCHNRLEKSDLTGAEKIRSEGAGATLTLGLLAYLHGT